MFRGTTAWAALAILTAALLALPFFAPTAAFATAHTPRQAEAKAQPGIKLPGKALRDETATQRHCAPAGDPTGPLRTRDRQRTVEVALAGPERPTQAQDPSAALQVFRC